VPLDRDTAKFIVAMGFGSADTACVSPDKYAYHSEAVRDIILREEIHLRPNPGTKGVAKTVRPEELLLLSINPIKGPREDANVYRFQNFLVEMDGMPLAEQQKYVQSMGMPYTAAVYSGGKSIHYVISLKEDMPDESSWRLVAEWILNVMDKADQQTKNPSRMVRIPGAHRPGGRQQRLISATGPISRADLFSWLSQWPHKKPLPPKPPRAPLKEPSFDGLAKWVRNELIGGLDESKGRNNRWFAIAYELALAGYSEDDALDILSRYYTEDRSFRRKEWESTVRHAYRKVAK